MDDSNLVQGGTYYSYDSTLKKLMNIIKSKTSDNIKQLEDLWESINTNNIQPINIVPINSNSNNNKNSSRTSPARSSSSQSPVHLSESSNDSTNSNSNSSNLKRDASKMCTSPVDSAIKKPKLENNNKSKTSPDSKTVKELESAILSVDSDSIDSIKVQNEKTEINNMTVDMLDFSCSICKQFNQELNNKLIECRQCTHLYHQLCHNPKIDNSQLEQQQTHTDSSNDEQMVWYVSKCNKCVIENEQVDSEVDKINSEKEDTSNETSNHSNANKTSHAAVKHINGSTKPAAHTTSIDSWQFKKDKISPTNQKEIVVSSKTSNSLSSFSNLSTNNAVNNITLNSSTNSINSNGNKNGLTTNSTNGIKGLAGLATKLNPNINQQQPQQQPVNSTVATSNLKKSSNPDFLFKKFKESAGTVQTNENKTDLAAGAGKKTGLVTTQVSSTNPEQSQKKSTTTMNGLTNSNGPNKSLIKPNLVTSANNSNGTATTTTNNIHKKNPFNISNSLTTNKTSTSCATQNNLKEKKINSNLKPNNNNIQSSTAITTGNSSTCNTNRSSKIS